MINILNRLNFKNTFITSVLNINYYRCSAQKQYVRVRYAPSPTGFMHLGGLRTALFNYIFAKKHQGQFILRIQDTDKARQVQGSIQNIFQTLQWIQIRADESIKSEKQPYGPYIQSQRIEQYKNIEKLLLKNNLAYPCFCTYQNKNSPSKKDENKKDIQNYHKQSENIYPGTCRKLTFQDVKSKIKNGQKYAVRLKSDLYKHPQFFVDQNYGKIPFTKFDDFIIVKQDGWPTFHFANVIDDWKMKITHVIRGQQWLTNTSKHIYLYKILDAAVPKFIHLPLIKNHAGKKLAKRDPGSSLVDIKQNYQPKAIKNYLLRLGWTPESNQKQNNKSQNKQEKKDQLQLQLWQQVEMIQKFDLEHLMKSSAKFDVKMMNFYNRKYLKNLWRKFQKLQKECNKIGSQKDIKKNQQKNQIFNYFRLKLQKQIPQAKLATNQIIQLVWSIVYQRISKNQDLKQFSYFFKNQKIFYEDDKHKKDLKALFGPQAKIINNKIVGDQSLIYKNLKILHNVRLILEQIIPSYDFKQQILSMRLSEFLVQNVQIKNQQLFHLIRFILTGHKRGPTASRSMIIIGRERVLKAFQTFHQILKPKNIQS